MGSIKNAISTVKDTIEDMRYGSSAEKGLYWFIRIGTIVLLVFIVLIIVGLVYTKIKGIQIQKPW